MCNDNSNKRWWSKITIIKYGSLVYLLPLILFLLHLGTISQSQVNCSEILNSFKQNFDTVKIDPAFSLTAITKQELITHTKKAILLVPEFQFIYYTANKMGLRVWLFGGTASSFLHYVKWDLARNKGLLKLQNDRFDYDYTNIFRSTQDLDIVIDAKSEVAIAFQNVIAEKYPYFLGSKAKWEIRTLRERMGKPGDIGFKESLLNDTDFINQNSDSNSLGMVEITQYKNEPIIRDLKDWASPQSVFLDDTLKNEISFYRSKLHFTTFRARSGENPEILSVIRFLVKAFQYELNISKSDLEVIKSIVNQFSPSEVTNSNALRRIQDTAKKLILHAVNIEYALNILDVLGLRKKLIAMGDPSIENSVSWWLNREPLRSFPIGRSGTGLTAEEMGITVVAHETNSFMAYESITRAHSGEPNVLISRQNSFGEVAVHGNGFYTKIGKVGAAGTGLTIRFKVNPEAREGDDFSVVGNYVIFKNKKALTVIPESLNFGFDDLIKLAETNEQFAIDHSDLALLEKLKRKLNVVKIKEALDKLLNSKNKKDQDRLVHVLGVFQNTVVQQIITKEVLDYISKTVYQFILPLANASSINDRIQYIQTVGPLIKSLDSLGILKSSDFFKFLYKQLKLVTSGTDTNTSFRNKILYELILSDDNVDLKSVLIQNLTASELNACIKEIKNWSKSKNPRNRNFIKELENRWSAAIANGNIKIISDYVELGIFDINQKNISKFSILQLAAYYNQTSLIEWIVSNSNFNFNSKSDLGFTEVDQLKLSGKIVTAEMILSKRPEAFTHKIQIHDRNTDGTPIVDFVRIEPGSFMMGYDKDKVLTTITKPFEIMSILTTVEIYYYVVDLLIKNLNKDYDRLYPPHFSLKYLQKGSLMPKDSVSYNDVKMWLQGLCKLSKLDKLNVQNDLTLLIPGHKKGDQYRLPTEAEWEFATRLGGLAEGDYSHGSSNENLGDYAIYVDNSNRYLHEVGDKKPVFYNGKPLYDLQGNLNAWVNDWYEKKLLGGVNPQGPSSSSSLKRVARGGSYFHDYDGLRFSFREDFYPGNTTAGVGFRLVRTVK